ncbi:cysteine desulfurase family protein [Bacillus sp. B15-48]|uniref:cysteine desulfurase family protein n=1 Tax=Bacillus sp. B15-48 TaxID=1548601 RepID=UPI00193F0B86|nr:cysteine desulfurase family protein [Bacillus sp. B15-48]MBM4762571.1 aminotransferase class V-fold PLP-dependent enzyme [Bacillus sp. B15-48]
MIYFDNSATTKPFHEVLQSFIKVSSDYFGNPSSLHQIGGQAEKLLSQAQSQMAGLLGVKMNEVVFTSGGTEGNNLAIKGTAIEYYRRGKHLITTTIEHPSVRSAFEQLEKLGFEVTYIPVDADGFVRPADIERAIRADTILVSIIHINNEVGTIQPIKEIGQILKGFPKIIYHVDHVQGAGKVALDFYQCGIDLCTLSGHKFHGVKGTGAMFIRNGVKIAPLLSGGGQQMDRRNGTENVAGIVAMAKALRMSIELRKRKMDELYQILGTIRSGLKELPNITIHTPEEKAAPHILNFSVKGLKAEVFVHSLEEKGVIVSTTSACSSKRNAPSNTLLAMGVNRDEAERAIRISLSYENTLGEAKKVVKAISESVKQLGEVRK